MMRIGVSIRMGTLHFEAMWMKDERCEGVIINAWEGLHSDNPMTTLVHKIDKCRTKLKTWIRISFGHIQKLLSQKKKLLAQAEALSMAGQNHEQVHTLRGEVYDLMLKEDCMWQQRLRVIWLKDGDLNTSYFHSRATQRNRRNFISKLKLEDGSEATDEKQIGAAMVEYFKNLFTSVVPSNFETILQGVECKVTRAMNVDLAKDFKLGKWSKPSSR